MVLLKGAGGTKRTLESMVEGENLIFGMGNTGELERDTMRGGIDGKGK